MATWEDFGDLAQRIGARPLNDTAWVFELPGCEPGRAQKVFAFLEIIEPGFEVLQVKSAFAPIAEVDAEAVIRRLGQMTAGAIGYTPVFDALGNPTDGFVNLSSSIPLAALDLHDPTAFLVYLTIVAQAADDLEHRIATSATLDSY